MTTTPQQQGQDTMDRTGSTPDGWQLVFAQTRRDETGVMTLPLTGHGFAPDCSVLESPEHGPAAAEIGRELDETWTTARIPASNLTDAGLEVMARGLFENIEHAA